MTPAPRLAGSAPAARSPALPSDELVGVVRRGLLRRHAAVALEHFEHLFPVVLVRPADRMSLGAGGVELLFERNLKTFAQQIAAEIGIELETGLDSGVRLLCGGFPTLLARRHELFDEIGRLRNHFVASDQAGAIRDQSVTGIGNVFCSRQPAA